MIYFDLSTQFQESIKEKPTTTFEPPSIVKQSTPPSASASAVELPAAVGYKSKAKGRAAGGGASGLILAASTVQAKLTTNKLSSMLFKYKEQLKKDIANKRSRLEKELSSEISKVRRGANIDETGRTILLV